MIAQHQSAAARAAVLAATVLAPTLGLAEQHKPVGEFEEASIHVEHNATDGDTELAIEALPLSDLGLKSLSVFSPRWRRVLEVEAPARSGGLREFEFETPEPEESAILASYPEGEYFYFGVGTDGRQFLGTAELSHELPAPTTIVFPQDEQEVPVAPLTIQWTAVPGVVHYIVELENESVDPELSLTFDVPPDVTSFAVPQSLIVPGGDYELGIATVHENGNLVFVEVGFSTSE